MPEVLAVLPMRGGSKSIPLKSISPLLGRPMCHYTIIEAKKSKLINRFIIYTGHPQILEVAKQYGVEVPILEQEEKQEDISMFRDILDGLLKKENYKPDIVIHLKATSPLRVVDDIDTAVRMLIDDSEADSVRGVCSPELTPFKMYMYDETKNKYLQPFLTKEHFQFLGQFRDQYAMPRELFPKVVRHTGIMDVYRCVNIMEKNTLTGKNILPYYVDRLRIASINHADDVPLVEFLLKRQGRDKDD